ncbi:MAG: permease [Micavibrio aeruginosavorus]|uniref:Probable membrane transporter protein n=1 Tax=Micavibrio aeruginosavorus TaxID=349221 RepID=A0A2W5MZG2_9BACT|nr:MAG: permease [Micavibrio aeruginosavorus]
MQVYLPIAEMSVPAESLALLGIAVGFLSGLFGVGGGFLATPFLLFMGIPPAVAVGTQANQLIATSVTAVLGHWRRGNVDIHLGSIMLVGGMVGSVAGIFLFRMLQHFGQIDLFIAVSYVLLLGSIGVMMLIESVMAVLNRAKVTEDVQSVAQRPFFRNLPYKTRFMKSRLYISSLLPIGVGFLGGLMISVLGIGGGFVMVPAMIYILGMPSLLVAGTSLFQIIFISSFACILHAVANGTVDVMLALIMTAGGVVGAQVGVRLARRVKGAPARVALALIIVGVCIRMLFELFVQPVDIFTLDIRK